jgi:hypothetical protein
MGNMNYCRFEKTLDDLMDCRDHINDMDLSDSELKYRNKLIVLCREIADDNNEDD